MTRLAFRFRKLALPTLAAWLGTTAAARADFGGAVSPSAYELFHLGPLPVTNTMVTSWVFVALIIIGFRLLAGRPQLIPTRGQAVVEHILQIVRGIVEPIVGAKMLRPTFPLLSALFVYILISNWASLLPGAGTFGFSKEGTVNAEQAAVLSQDHYHVEDLGNGQFHVHKFDYFFRPVTADLNTPAALAVVAMVGWLYFVLRYAGFGALVKDLFGNKADRKELPLPMYLLLSVIFLCVGVIEVVSILFRPVSLSFRLFGNVFGGENLLSNMHGIFAYLLPVPFYFLEVLIGLIQAFVFTLLVAVYIGLICNHDGGHDHDDEHGHEGASAH